MSVNFSQNRNINYPQNNNFGAVNVQDAVPKEQMNLLQSMDIPTNKKELKSWIPNFATAMGLSVLISKLTKLATFINPLKNPNVTVEDSFNQSIVGKTTAKIDKFSLPVINKLAPKMKQASGFLDRHVPKYFKDLFFNIKEKFSIGMKPKDILAAGQARGLSVSTADDILAVLQKVDETGIKKLGLTNILNQFKAQKINSKEAVEQITQQFKNSKITIKDFQSIVKDKQALMKLNVARSFIGTNTKSKFSKILQKLFMYSAEGAGGGVAGGMILGTIMNSIFLASAIKKTWNAPWEDKFSTFMESAMCDFCGGMLVNMVVAPRLTYKMLGLQNLDKSAKDLKRIKQLDTAIRNAQVQHKALSTIANAKNPKIIAENLQLVQELCIKYKINPSSMTIEQLQQALKVSEAKSALKINNAIQKLAKAKAFKSQGFWKDLIHKPIHYIGKIMNVGLENLPAKVQGQMMVKGHLKTITKGAAFRSKLWNITKGAAGYWRFILVTGFVVSPMINILAKISHLTFGKPKKCYYGKEADENNKAQPTTDKNTKQPYKVDMNAFSQYTKATGEWKAKQQPQLKSKYTPQISPKFVEHAINSRKNPKQNNPEIKNISPAKYIPQITPMNFSNPGVLANLQNNLIKSNSVENYTKRELAAMQDKENIYDF